MYLPMAGKTSYVITLHLLMILGREKKRKIREREKGKKKKKLRLNLLSRFDR